MWERTPKRTAYLAQTIPRLSQNPSSLSGRPACGEWVSPAWWTGPSRKSRCIAYAPSLAQWEPFSCRPSIKSLIFTNQAQWVYPNQRYAVFVCVAVNPGPPSFTAKPTSLGTREDLELINSLSSSSSLPSQMASAFHFKEVCFGKLHNESCFLSFSPMKVYSLYW